MSRRTPRGLQRSSSPRSSGLSRDSTSTRLAINSSSPKWRSRVNETLKGPHVPSMSVLVEGGTVGDLTMDVSDLPSLQPQERAVFFLAEGRPGDPDYRPHGRGLGILTLDATDHITGSDVTLDDVRRAVRESGTLAATQPED